MESSPDERAALLMQSRGFAFTPRQLEALAVLGGPATHLLLEGGSRSGKTFLLLRSLIVRAVKAPGSRHVVLRFRFNHLKASVIFDTLPKVLELAFPQVRWTLNKTDWFMQLWNGSQIWFGGLDDKDRTERILGQEHATIYLNEISQIPYESRNLAVTRLAQRVEQQLGGEASWLPLRLYYDCNPLRQSHWAYKLFHLKVDPETNTALPQPADFACFRLNPEDNLANISPEYLATLRSLPARLQRRFLLGEWAAATPDALFDDAVIDRWRVLDGRVPDLLRVVVAVDPSGAGKVDDGDHDAIGIMVVGLGTDGRAYVLEDCTVTAGPAVWGSVATQAYDRHEADAVVGEENFGGAMVSHVIQTARPRTPYKSVHASRGKAVRAEPFSALYEQGKICHVGVFRELEDELVSFTTHGYEGPRSPNRADALIWALAELFPALVAGKRERRPERAATVRLGASAGAWMA